MEDLKELQKKNAAELYELATKIWGSYASTAAMVRLGESGGEDLDELLPITIHFKLDEAMRVGDVGRMEDMPPHLLFWFIWGIHWGQQPQICSRDP